MGIVLALLCALFFAIFYVFVQIGMKNSEGNNGFFATTTFNVITLSIIYLIVFFTRTESPIFNLPGFLFFVLAGFFTAFLGRSALFAAIQRMGSVRSAALKNAAPLFSVLFAVTFIGEHITFSAAIGMFTILSALFFHARYDYINAQSGQKGKENNNWGILLGVFAAIFFGFGQAIRKLGIIHYDDPIFGALIGVSVAWIAFFLVETLKSRFRSSVVNGLKVTNRYFILAGISSGISQAFFFLSATLTNVSYTSVVAATEPILIIILAKIFLANEETINLRIILTVCVVFLGTSIILIGQN
jgi:drug/metabolite transporter (DMT)-like permease